MYVEMRESCAIQFTSSNGIATCPDIDNILAETCVGIGIHVRMHWYKTWFGCATTATGMYCLGIAVDSESVGDDER